MGSKKDLDLYQRMVRIESQNENQCQKIDEIHKLLVGNGKPGLVNEFNTWKGIVKGIGMVFGLAITALSLILAFLK